MEGQQREFASLALGSDGCFLDGETGSAIGLFLGGDPQVADHAALFAGFLRLLHTTDYSKRTIVI